MVYLAFQKSERVAPKEKPYFVGLYAHICGVCGNYIIGIKGKKRTSRLWHKNKCKATVRILHRKALLTRSLGCTFDMYMDVTHEEGSKSKESMQTKVSAEQPPSLPSPLSSALHRIRWNTTNCCLSELLPAEEWGTHAIHHVTQITNRGNVTSSLECVSSYVFLLSWAS